MTHPFDGSNVPASPDPDTRCTTPARSASQLAYDALLPLACAIPRNQVLRVNLDPMTVAAECVGVAERLAPHRARFAALVDFDLTAFDGLGPAGLALYVANASRRITSRTPASVDALFDRGITLRRELREWGPILVRAGLVPAAAVRPVRGRGYRALANDLLAWVELLRKTDLAAFPCAALPSRETLDEAAAVGEQLMAAFGERALRPLAIQHATDTRARFFTLAVTRYRHVRTAALYLAWPVGNGDDMVPSLYSGRMRNVLRSREQTVIRCETRAARERGSR